jgi:hypothetical protein
MTIPDHVSYLGGELHIIIMKIIINELWRSNKKLTFHRKDNGEEF